MNLDSSIVNPHATNIASETTAAGGKVSAQKLSHLLALDGVRGVAALMVMIFHYWQGKGFDRLGIPAGISKVAVFGQTGVDLFFVLSGFLITRILISSREQPCYFRNFYGRRVLRILPLYYLFLVIYFFVLPVIENSPVEPFGKTWWYWFYLQNFPDTFTHLSAAGPLHYWSLAVEEHFYMFWPLLVYLAPVRALTWWSVAVIGLTIAVRALFVFGLSIGVFYFTLCRMDALAFGALLACLEASGRLQSCRKITVFILAVLLPPLIFAWTRLTGSGADFLQVIKFSFIGLVYFAILGLVVLYKDSIWIGSLLGNRFLRWVGKISYGLYVYHGLCYYLVDKGAFLAPALNLLFSFALAFLVSYLSFRFFEMPFLRLKRFFQD